MAALAHPLDGPCTDDTSNRAERTSQRIHARVFVADSALLVHGFGLGSCGL